MFEVSFSQPSRLNSFFLLVSAHLRLVDGRESGWTPGVGDGQGGLACCNSWGCKESDTTEWLNWTEGWSSGLCKLCIRWDLCWVFVCLLAFPLMGKAEWGGDPVCWWLGLYFCFVCCLGEVSCTGCYWWLGDGGSCIQVVSFVWVLTILILPRVSSLVV